MKRSKIILFSSFVFPCYIYESNMLRNLVYIYNSLQVLFKLSWVFFHLIFRIFGKMLCLNLGFCPQNQPLLQKRMRGKPQTSQTKKSGNICSALCGLKMTGSSNGAWFWLHHCCLALRLSLIHLTLRFLIKNLIKNLTKAISQGILKIGIKFFFKNCMLF